MTQRYDHWGKEIPEAFDLPSSPLPTPEVVQWLSSEHRRMVKLAIKDHWNTLDPRLQEIILKYLEHPTLSKGQAKWLARETSFKFEKSRLEKPEDIELPPDPILLYGDFKAIYVMFKIAGESLKQPKVRLVSKEDTFVQLTFKNNWITIHRDGWQGHGQRKYVGVIKEGALHPWEKHPENLTEDIITLLQDFALDPMQVAKASANKLGCCSFCASRLSDPESKERGYGLVCAEHYGLAWGKHTKEERDKISEIHQSEDLNFLFEGEKTAGDYHLYPTHQPKGIVE